MEMKQNVKQRRHERLKRLQEHDAHRSEGGDRDRGMSSGEYRLPVSGVPAARQSELPVHSDDSRWNDPEYAWKHRGSHGQAVYGGVYEPQPDEPRFRLSPPTQKQLWVRIILCALLFAGIWGMFRLPYPWAQAGKSYVTAALTEPMNMDALAAWYESKLRGMPSILPSFRRSGDESVKVSSSGNRTFFAPAKGVVSVPFSGGKQGILVRTQEDSPVYAMDTGLVTFAGAKEGTGFTVELQHPNGLRTTYGLLEECKLEVNDWIKGGEAIGKAAKQTEGGELYFAVQKDGRYVNPADVVSIVR